MKLVLLALVASGALFAHTGEPLEPHDLWKAWEFDPGIVIPLVLSAVLYWRGATDKHGIRRWERACFWAGWAALVIALVSPVHPLGEALFSAHMVQHELLMVVAAPLLVLGRPLVPFLWAMPAGLGRVSILKVPLAAAWLIHAIVLWAWHAPALFQATLSSDFVHSLQHISFLGSALIFWWALFRRKLAYGPAILYVFTTAVHTTILGALLTFSPTLWYPAYSKTTAAWGLTALEDQQLGGLVMWVPAGLTFIIAGVYLTALWMRDSEARVLARESESGAGPRPAAGSQPARLSRDCHDAALRNRRAGGPPQATGLPHFTLALIAVAFALCTSCSDRTRIVQAAEITGGNPHTGKNKIAYYGCGSCHTIKGVAGAIGLVGPPLDNVSRRVYLGGVLTNTPTNMAHWIRNPKQFDEKTAMPVLFVTEQDARDMTAYLYSLK